MPDLTRDEWDDMQEGWDANGSPSITWQCDYCKGWTEYPYFDEGDLIECERCNIRLDAREYYRLSDEVDIDFDFLGDYFTPDLAFEARLKHFLKG